MIALKVKVPSGDNCEDCQFFTQFSYRDQPRCALFSEDVAGMSQNFTKCQACVELASLQENNQNKVRAVTAEELTTQFLEYIHGLVDYWVDTERESTRAKLEGLVFSILSTLDGERLEFPAFDIVACPHPEEKAFRAAHGENYIEDGTTLEPWLHEKWYGK